MSNRVDKVQAVLLGMGVGMTRAVFGVVVTRWAKDAFEVGAFGREAGIGSEAAAEDVVAHADFWSRS